MKPSEEYAQKKLVEHLQGKGSDVEAKEGSDPPDFLFVVNGEKWAVEVTELHQYVEHHGEKSTIAIERHLFNLFKKIDAETANRTRGYVVSLKGPMDAGLSKEIVARATEHILTSKNGKLSMGSANEIEVVPQEKDTKLHWVIMVDGKTPGGETTSANIQASINHALGRILGEKVPRLGQFTQMRKVLLIVSEYFFADSENVRNGLQARSKEIRPVDEIYLVWDGQIEVVHP